MAVRLSATGDARASESPPGSEGSGTAKCRLNTATPVRIRADGSISYDTVISVGQKSPVDRRRMTRLQLCRQRAELPLVGSPRV